MILFDARASELAEHLPRWRRGVARALLGGFAGLHARDGAARDLLLRLGADPARIEVSGALEEGAQALECEEAERVRLAGQIAARPAWCVAGCTELEEALVLRAHAQARRLTYRLLLVVATDDPGRAPWLAARCREAGLTAVLHGSGAPVRETVDVLIGAGEADMGLFYRLASVTFMGGTLNGAGGRSPFEPAALGSAILHGPLTGRHAGLYARLGAAGATREVDSAEALAQALEATLVPARAAEAALAAWDVASRGVEVADRAATLIETVLAEGNAA
jgi:3-deoxy-D-manno-octulosonic-acid transferase